MKIRNLQQYIRERCSRDSKESLNLLFTDDEPFLYEILGDRGSVESMVRGCATIAKDAEQQVFYEFVQNAFDAGGDSVFFYIGDVDGQDYLLVLNNGKPFYTDKKVDKKVAGKKNREGQLFSFLNTNKSGKPNEPSIGKFGQGSKLLYTLLPDVKRDIPLDELMAPALIGEKRAPYLISWAKGEQLNNFLMDRNIWDRECGYDNDEFLIAKIFCCYYPLEPGVDEALFSNDEVSRLVKVFNKLVDPRRNMNRLQGSGTALIIPLGSGKRGILSERVEKVKNRLAPFASIIGNYKEFAGKHLSRIVFLGDEIKPIDAESVCAEIIREDGKKIKYQFVFDESFNAEDCVNLYKALPISDTVYGLNFIIDSQGFPVEGSRQNINDEVVINNIANAMRVFVTEFDTLKNNDKEKCDRIYDCLIKARPNNDVVRKPFNEVILPYLEKNVHRADGTYGERETTFVVKNGLNIPFDEIGVSDIYVAADNIADDYKELGMPIKNITLETIIEKADDTKLADWIKGLAEDAYEAYHNEVVKIIKRKAGTKLLRTNYGHVVSYNEVCDQQSDIYFVDVAPSVFKGSGLVEYVELPLTDAALPSYSKNRIIEKIKRQASSTNREKVEFFCSLLNELNDSTCQKKIREEVALLENCKGEKKAFCDLFKTRPNDTILYEKFVARAPLPQQLNDSWFVSNSELWGWLKRNWNEVKQLDDWKEYHEKYLSDIKKAWNASGDRLALWLNKDGEPVEERQVVIKGSYEEGFAEEDYAILEKIFKGKGYSLVPYKFRMELVAPCLDVEKLGLEDLIPKTDSVIELNVKELRVIVGVTGDSFWEKYVVTEQRRISFEVKRMPYGGRNYCYGHELNSEEECNLRSAKFYRIPRNVVQLMGSNETDYTIDKNIKLLEQAMYSVPSKRLLFNIVKRNQHPDIVKKFSEKIESLEFSTDKEIDEQRLDCAIIKWYSAKEDELKDNIWKKIVVDGKPLPIGKLCPNEVKVGGYTYHAYELVHSLAEEDSLVRSLLAKLPDSLKFEKNYCAKRRQTIEPADLMDKLDTDHLTVKQLEFALDYWKTDKADIHCLHLSEEASLKEALAMIANRKFVRFYEKFVINGLKPERQIYAPEELLLEEERLPQAVYDWVCGNENVLSLFGEHLYRDHSLIKLRKAFRRDESLDSIGKKQEKDDWILKNTFRWLVKLQEEKAINITRDSNAFKNMRLLQGWMESDDDIYLLKYTTELQHEKMVFCLSRLIGGNIKFMPYDEKLPEFLDEQNRNSDLVSFLTKNDVFLPLKSDEMRKLALANEPQITIKYESKHDENWKEWGDAVYKKWLNVPESKSICIFLSSHTISSTLKLMDGDECCVELPMLQGALYGISLDENRRLFEVAVKYPNDQDPNVYKALQNQVVPNVKDFQEPFIALQGLKIDETTDETIEDQDKEKNELAQNIDTKVLEILTNHPVDPYKLQLLVDGKLHEGTGDGNGNGTGNGNGGQGGGNKVEEKDDETKKNMISGYIGELLYKCYLERTHKNYCWEAQDNDEGRYDFSIDKEFYIEVKTNVKSIMDGESPFYLHKSQMDFLHTIDTNNYYVCRLSIDDLNLMDGYREILRRYGIETDPRLPDNESLRRECRNLVDSYWQCAESVELFKQMRRMYRIKDIFLESIRSYESV